jgi:hypothetical protein
MMPPTNCTPRHLSLLYEDSILGRRAEPVAGPDARPDRRTPARSDPTRSTAQLWLKNPQNVTVATEDKARIASGFFNQS